MSNRLLVYRDAVQAKIDNGGLNGALATPEARERFDKGVMALAEFERFAYQKRQAHAHAAGVLSTDEALFVYRAIGEVGDPDNGGWASGTDLATKVTVTKLMAQLYGIT